jgi:hypothetical protein
MRGSACAAQPWASRGAAARETLSLRASDFSARPTTEGLAWAGCRGARETAHTRTGEKAHTQARRHTHRRADHVATRGCRGARETVRRRLGPVRVHPVQRAGPDSMQGAPYAASGRAICNIRARHMQHQGAPYAACRARLCEGVLQVKAVCIMQGLPSTSTGPHGPRRRTRRRCGASAAGTCGGAHEPAPWPRSNSLESLESVFYTSLEPDAAPPGRPSPSLCRSAPNLLQVRALDLVPAPRVLVAPVLPTAQSRPTRTPPPPGPRPIYVTIST